MAQAEKRKRRFEIMVKDQIESMNRFHIPIHGLSDRDSTTRQKNHKGKSFALRYIQYGVQTATCTCTCTVSRCRISKLLPRLS